MEIIGNHLQSMKSLNVAITNIGPARSGLGVGIQRSDGTPDPKFARFHQVPMTGTDILQFISNVETLRWERSPSSGLENKSQVNAGNYQVELFSVMHQDQAIDCFVKLLTDPANQFGAPTHTEIE